jgi:hypothetical protein
MQKYNDRFMIRKATTEDGPEIVTILEEEASPGNPQLVFSRRPNGYLSMKREGEHVCIWICIDTSNSEIVGFGAYSINTCFVNGVISPVAYLFGLRCRKKYRLKASRMIPLIYNQIYHELQTQKVTIVFTTILSENIATKNMFTKSHKNIPDYIFLDRYEVFVLSPKKQHFRKVPETITCTSAKNLKKETVVDFFLTEGKKRECFPLIHEQAALPEDFFEECLVLFDKTTGNIVAAGYCWNQRSYKQLIVAGYHGILKMVQPISGVLQFLGFPSLPSKGQELNIATLSFYLVRDERDDYFDWFLAECMKRNHNADQILIGAGPQFPHRKQLEKRPHWNYTSDIYLVEWNKSHDQTALKTFKPTYLQCGWL